MKKIIYCMLLAAISLSFTACGDDDDPNPNQGGKFVWKGDWSNPDDPGYRPNYNPLKGVWQSEGGGIRWWFSDDYILRTASRDNDWRYFLYSDGKYEVNDTGYRLKNIRGTGKIYTYEYKIVNENGEVWLHQLQVTPVFDGEKYEWKKLKRIAETAE